MSTDRELGVIFVESRVHIIACLKNLTRHVDHERKCPNFLHGWRWGGTALSISWAHRWCVRDGNGYGTDSSNVHLFTPTCPAKSNTRARDGNRVTCHVELRSPCRIHTDISTYIYIYLWDCTMLHVYTRHVSVWMIPPTDDEYALWAWRRAWTARAMMIQNRLIIDQRSNLWVAERRFRKKKKKTIEDWICIRESFIYLLIFCYLLYGPRNRALRERTPRPHVGTSSSSSPPPHPPRRRLLPVWPNKSCWVTALSSHFLFKDDSSGKCWSTWTRRDWKA